MNKLTFAALLLTTPLSVFPEEAPQREMTGITVKGLVLVPKPSVDDNADVEGVQTRDLTVPGGSSELEKTLAKLVLGKPLTSDLLSEIKRTIILYYRSRGRPMVSVTIPEQDISSGVIEVVVIEAKVGKVTSSGNRWFKSKLIESYLDIEPGDVITDDTLLTDVTWMNRNPFRRTDIVFTPGEQFGTTDIELVTHDRFPLRFFGGGDNTGNDATENERWYAGVNWGNAFFCDHQLNYQYTGSSNFHDYEAHTLNYTAPLPWRHILILFGGYSTVHPDLSSKDEQFGEFKSHGHSAQASVRYQIPFGKSFRSTIKELVVGFDYKNTNNNLEFLNEEVIPLVTKTVNITQLVAGFNWGKETGHHRFSCSADAYWSPGTILPHQSNADFENLRPGAKKNYIYGKLTVGDVYRFPADFSISLLLRGQIADKNLLPSEQQALGGFNTVRGYNEREIFVDNAFIGNFELLTFPFHLFREIGDELIFLGFVDYAIGRNHSTLDHPEGAFPAEKKTVFLFGAGPGLRYTINPYLSVRVDWGFKLHRTHFDDPHMSKVHFGFIGSY